jgi:hypothetical protein
MQKKFAQSLQPALPGRTIGGDLARPSAREIAALAHELWKARGCPEGSPETDWLRAEEQLRRSEDTGMMAA